MTIVEEMLGIRATEQGLRLSPLLPTGWTGYKASRLWCGCRYEIAVSGYRKGATPAIRCDGVLLKDNLLPRASSGVRVVEVTYP